MNRTNSSKIKSGRLPVTAVAWLVLLFSLAGAGWLKAAVVTESRVKALFLVKFAQYVEWPAAVLADTNAPIVIGVVGDGAVGEELNQAIQDRTANGHPFVLRHLTADADPGGCQILFISDRESAGTGKILEKTAGQPILTVGEDKEFADHDGMINFVFKADSVHLDINLAPAKKAGLKISSKLLSVADEVKGR
jgi:hypothetical protein